MFAYTVVICTGSDTHTEKHKNANSHECTYKYAYDAHTRIGTCMYSTIVCLCTHSHPRPGHEDKWAPKLQRLATDLFNNCILRPTNRLLEHGGGQSDYLRVGRFSMKLYPSKWLSQHIAADTTLRLFLQRVSSR